MSLKKTISETRELVGRVHSVQYSKQTEQIVSHFEIQDIENGVVKHVETSVVVVPVEKVLELFSIQRMNLENENPVKSVYLFLKSERPIFFDWSDC